MIARAVLICILQVLWWISELLHKSSKKLSVLKEELSHSGITLKKDSGDQ